MARKPVEVEVTITYTELIEKLRAARREGVQAERERIIALLIEKRSLMSHHSDYYNDPFTYAIALIKGETE